MRTNPYRPIVDTRAYPEYVDERKLPPAIGELPDPAIDCPRDTRPLRRPCVGPFAIQMKFRSNNRVKVHLPDLKKAEAFFTGVLGFRLLEKSATQLEYDTGRFLLCVGKANGPRSPIPSFTVIDAKAAKAHLLANGCEIVDDRGSSLYFKDPFGMVYDVIED